MRDRSVTIWLVSIYFMVFAMVIVGGTTRLTGSGLSMVEWHPLMGALPPLDYQSWLKVFAQYQESPQYQQVNQWMTLGDFKQIFFWEYFHRLLGRLIGVIFIIPWFVFLARRQLSKQLAKRTAIAFFLGGGQGLLGWLMVKSGLANTPEVSHYRLAAHLLLAFAVALWILWILLDIHDKKQYSSLSQPSLLKHCWALFLLIAFQCIYGAFMAGTKAGYFFDTFPMMNGHWVPSSLFTMNPAADPIAIHFIHRTLAWITATAVLLFSWKALKESVSQKQKKAALALLVMTFLQFLLGVLTVIFHMPIKFAVAHQACGFLLLSFALYNVHAWKRRSLRL